MATTHQIAHHLALISDLRNLPRPAPLPFPPSYTSLHRALRVWRRTSHLREPWVHAHCGGLIKAKSPAARGLWNQPFPIALRTPPTSRHPDQGVGMHGGRASPATSLGSFCRPSHQCMRGTIAKEHRGIGYRMLDIWLLPHVRPDRLHRRINSLRGRWSRPLRGQFISCKPRKLSVK